MYPLKEKLTSFYMFNLKENVIKNAKCFDSRRKCTKYETCAEYILLCSFFQRLNIFKNEKDRQNIGQTYQKCLSILVYRHRV